jgi:death-on-curing protein
MTSYLTLDEVLALHTWSLGAFGGSEGVLNINSLDSAVSQPMQSFSGQEAYPTIYEKAAALCHGIAMNHPFVDGNKRVAFAAMNILLSRNGVTLSCDQNDAVEIMTQIASGQLNRDGIADWIRANCEVDTF